MSFCLFDNVLLRRFHFGFPDLVSITCSVPLGGGAVLWRRRDRVIRFAFVIALSGAGGVPFSWSDVVVPRGLGWFHILSLSGEMSSLKDVISCK